MVCVKSTEAECALIIIIVVVVIISAGSNGCSSTTAILLRGCRIDFLFLLACPSWNLLANFAFLFFGSTEMCLVVSPIFRMSTVIDTSITLKCTKWMHNRHGERCQFTQMYVLAFLHIWRHNLLNKWLLLIEIVSIFSHSIWKAFGICRFWKISPLSMHSNVSTSSGSDRYIQTSKFRRKKTNIESILSKMGYQTECTEKNTHK